MFVDHQPRSKVPGSSDANARELPELSREELLRYARHLALPGYGLEGQRWLRRGRIIVVGAGGLGSPISLYLAAAGVGTLGLVDCDTVSDTDLQRQVLYGTSSLGVAKLTSAEARLRDLNPHVDIERFDVRLTSANALDILSDFDIVIDGSDNFPTRYLVNDACVLLGKPYVYGAIFRYEGQASVFGAQDGPCYRCLFRDPPPPGLVPSCSEAGVLGVVPGVIGSIQALEAIKLLLGRGDTLIGRLLRFDALKLAFRELKLRRDPECPVCGVEPTVRELIDYEAFCGEGSAGIREVPTVTPKRLQEELASNQKLAVIDVRQPWEWEICRIDGAMQIPLSVLDDRMRSLNPESDLVVVCHHGADSLRALDVLKHAGFSSVRTLEGGIDAWAREVDPRVARY